MCVLCVHLLTGLEKYTKDLQLPCKAHESFVKKWTYFCETAFVYNGSYSHADSRPEATSLTQVVKPESCPIMAATLSVRHYQHQTSQFSFPYM